MTDSILLIVALLLSVILAIAGLFRPFLGMLVFLVIHFAQPGELIPALEPFRIELVYGALLGGVVVCRVMSRPDHAPILSDRILLSSLLLIGAAVLSVPFAVWQGGAVASVVEMIKLVIVTFLLMMLVDSEARLRTLLWCLAGLTGWFAATSLSGFIHGEFYALKYDWGTLDRAQGLNSIVGGPNELAAVLVAMLPLLVVLLRTTQNIFARVLLISCGAISLAAISLTGSRIAMIGLVAMALYYTFQSKHKLLIGAGCLLIGALIWINLSPEYQQRYLTLESYAEGGQLDASNELRLEVWRAGWQMFSQRPILGVGAGQFANAYGMMYLAGKSGTWMNPHNLLIQVGCELGIIGLAAFGYFFWEIVKGIRFVFRRAREQVGALNYEVAIACSVICLGVIILSVVGHTLYRPYWYLLAGLVAANHNIVASKIAERSKLKGPVTNAASSNWAGGLEPSHSTRSAAFGGVHRRAHPKEALYRASYEYNRHSY